MRGTAVSLFDYTGVMLEPWLEAGYECHIFDIQHPPDRLKQPSKQGLGRPEVAEHALDEFEHHRMGRHLLPDLAVGQQVVRAGRAVSFETIVGRSAVEFGFKAVHVGK